uniref:Uncharacterized protein n=1 Tax=Aegilops tauschii TaxID=37682 RepID=N1QVP4_AEGTA
MGVHCRLASDRSLSGVQALAREVRHRRVHDTHARRRHARARRPLRRVPQLPRLRVVARRPIRTRRPGQRSVRSARCRAGFQRREAANYNTTIPVDEELDTSSPSADNTGSWATPQPCAAADEVLDVPAAALASDMFDFELDVSWVMDPGSRATSYPGCADKVFDLPAAALGDGDMFEFDLELDMFGEMDLSSHYADFAEGLLLEPPPPADAIEACWQNGDYYNDGGGDATLWSQY